MVSALICISFYPEPKRIMHITLSFIYILFLILGNLSNVFFTILIPIILAILYGYCTYELRIKIEEEMSNDQEL